MADQQVADPAAGQAATTPLRYAVYGLLIVTALGATVGRLCAVRSTSGRTPLLSANDRSRWATVRALVDHGTFALDDVIFRDAAQQKRDRDWYTIDMVRHAGRDGREHYYSSKPPLLATVVAGQYWLLQRLTGATLAEQPFYVVRILLIMTNVLPLAVYFLLLARLVERYGTTDWGRLFVFAAAAYGTFLTTFAVTLNNHLPAAISVAVAGYVGLGIWCQGRRPWWEFALAGFFAALAAANELPALSFAVLLGAALLWRAPWRTAAAFVPAVAVVAAAAFVTNYWAHGSWIPPYAHRHDGPLLTRVPGRFEPALARGEIPDALRHQLADVSIALSPQAAVAPRMTTAGWTLWDPAVPVRLALVADPDALRVHAWDHWYEFPGSYWTSGEKSAIDRGEPSRLAYAFHVLVGHHGVFSLTPLWLLSLVGLGRWLTGRGNTGLSAGLRPELCAGLRPRTPPDPGCTPVSDPAPAGCARVSDPAPVPAPAAPFAAPPVPQAAAAQRGLALFVLVLTVVCLTFYIARPLGDRNYGGATCGFRWVFWLAPLWLFVLLPAADALAARRVWRWVALGLLLLSVLSAAYAPLNPWSHPWLYQYWDSLGWVRP